MRCRVIAMIAGAAMLLAACASSGESTATNPPNDPGGTFATVPEQSSTDADTAPASTDAPTTVASSTTVPLEPSEDIDLPTASPEDLATAPESTVLVGPLPVPAIALTEIGQFDAPIEITTRVGDVRNFVVEQGGRILAVDDLSTDVVLDISALTSASGERGLLGAAFHPERDLAYVHYNDDAGTTVLAEFAVDPVTATFDAESRREVLTVNQPFNNHNGGEITFGPDGHLYIGLGDGGSANDPERNSLALSTRLGKILRIDPLESGDQPFTVPDDNPFVDVEGADPAIWALGLRNPWKFSFDTATGDLWIADVGQGDREEINFAPAVNGGNAGRGLSFGWSAFEGSARFNNDQPDDGQTPPIVEYSHDNGDCSVSGGAVYRGDTVANLLGWYVYGDFCSGRIWGYDTTSQAGDPVIVELTSLGNLAAISVGAEGDLFAVSTVGTVSRFTST